MSRDRFIALTALMEERSASRYSCARCYKWSKKDQINPLIEWFEKYYIGAERRRGNRVVQLDLRFPPEMWSVYQRTLDGASRTNNYAEAANRRIQSELGVCHHTLGNFILSLKKVQHGRDQQYMRWVSGRQPKDKRRKYKDADKRILKILQEYQRNERTVIELLRGIAQNIVIDDVVGIEDLIENDE
ncbi:hypothetical protein DdX_22323 [Ditylenchus destructor]|uniref:Uncharacterized protein n=1 Tax=Ditylenchus destructor TaxID=166010 RepID=A0AAD4QQY8_9BILA|nr:hypothetical protein DdX_22323 [Ditylenchus destructor]